MNKIIRKKQLSLKCRRGMLELDIIFEKFLKHGYDKLSDSKVALFEKLLDQPDPVLYAWLLNNETCDDSDFAELIKDVRSITHAFSP